MLGVEPQVLLTHPASARVVAAVADALRAGRPVVVPNPAPLTYVIAARDPRAVNVAKGRPAEQSVALHPDGSLTLRRPGAQDPSRLLTRATPE